MDLGDGSIAHCDYFGVPSLMGGACSKISFIFIITIIILLFIQCYKLLSSYPLLLLSYYYLYNVRERDDDERFPFVMLT